MSILETMSMFGFFATVLAMTFLVLLSLPKSRLRSVCLEIAGWLMAAICAIYCLSPVDILPEALLGPFGLPDDLLALVGGIYSAMTAWKSGREKKQLAA